MKLPYLPILALCLGLTSQVFAGKTIPNHAAANLVLGQTDFVSDFSPNVRSAASLNRPEGVIIDPVSRKVFVSDFGNRRILRYPNVSSLSNGSGAEAVFGQTRFSGSSSGSGERELAGPLGIHLDRFGRLWVADNANNRVLMYEAACYRNTNPYPDRVFGQPDFTTTTSGTTASKMHNPYGVWIDNDDRLWVADRDNHRILRFDSISSKASGSPADGVLGQLGFNTSTSGTDSSKMDEPVGVSVNSSGVLFVADSDNNRVLRFDNAASLGNGAGANAVLGQPNFTASSTGTTATTMSDPSGVLITTVGDLWVTDRNNERLLRFNDAVTAPSGSAADGVVGQPDFTTDTSLTTARGSIDSFCQTFIDAGGSLWIADTEHHRVLRFPPDTTKPKLTLKKKPAKSQTKKKLVIRGKATDAYGISLVQYRSGKGPWKKASGKGTWKVKTKLKLGPNRISIRAIDSVGNISAKRTVKVRRRSN